MCTHDLYRVGLFGEFRLIRTCVRMILIRHDCLVNLDFNTYMCTHDSYKAGLFGDLRLIHTHVRIILIRQNCFVTLNLVHLYA